jgi:hypothetical protein
VQVARPLVCPRAPPAGRRLPPPATDTSGSRV